MKKIEWILAMALMFMGLVCLSISATSDPGQPLVKPALFRVCIIICIVLAVAGVIYLWARWKRKR